MYSDSIPTRIGISIIPDADKTHPKIGTNAANMKISNKSLGGFLPSVRWIHVLKNQHSRITRIMGNI
jgi:hypothetical protein